MRSLSLVCFVWSTMCLLAAALLAPLSHAQVAQQAYVKASNTDTVDRFGCSVAVSGNTLVVGAFGEDSNASGINGDQSNNAWESTGAVYVFVRNGSAWTQQAYLKASNPNSTDGFGGAVAIDGDTLVVGAPSEDSSATGINGDESSNSAGNAGAAYVFHRSGTTWIQQAYIKASNTGANDGFGNSVSVSGDTILIGAWLEDSNAVGVDGDGTNNALSGSGAAYVFVRNGSSWTQQAYLKASNTGTNDRFGWAVGLSGNTAVVSAQVEDSNASGVNGDQNNNGIENAGAAYVFVRSGVVWAQQAYVKASNPGLGDFFGDSVAIWGDTLVVGAGDEDSNATGVNGNQINNAASGSGAAYVFVRNGATWAQQAYLKAHNTGAGDHFGQEVAIHDGIILVGAADEDSAATGIDGDGSNNTVSNSGAAYLFVRSGAGWHQHAYIKASNTRNPPPFPSPLGALFGSALSLSGSVLAVGAQLEDSNAIGVNNDQGNDNSIDSGAVYAFDYSVAAVGLFCFGDGTLVDHTSPCPCGNNGSAGNGCANSVNANGARLSGTGAPATDNVVLSSAGMPTSVSCIYLQGDGLDDAAFGDGVRCTGGSLLRLRTRANVGGASSFPDSTDTITLSQRGGVAIGGGAVRYYQTYYRNSAPGFCPPETFNVTNGVMVVW